MLYQVLPEKSSVVGGSMMGSSHVYDMASVSEHWTYVISSTQSGLNVGSARNDIEKGECMHSSLKYDCVYMNHLSML